jgi:hypothetical protein
MSLALGGEFIVLPLPYYGTQFHEHVKSVLDASMSRRVQKGKSAGFPNRSESMRRMTSARFERWISGGVKTGLDS